MSIKYKLKYQKNGLTITQEIDSSDSLSPVKPGAGAFAKALQGTFKESKAAAQKDAGTSSEVGGGLDPNDVGGGLDPNDRGGAAVPGVGNPITIFGPFIFMCPDQDDSKELIEVDEDE